VAGIRHPPALDQPGPLTTALNTPAATRKSVACRGSGQSVDFDGIVERGTERAIDTPNGSWCQVLGPFGDQPSDVARCEASDAPVTG
jgi:hypothetical protein